MTEEKKEELESEFPDKESKEIMDEIDDSKKEDPPEKEEKPEEDQETSTESEEKSEEKEEPPEKKEEAGEEGKKEDDEGEEPGDKKEEDKPKRTPKVMNVYDHKIAEKNWKKEEKELLIKIDDLNKKLERKKTVESKSKAIDDYCEKHGMDRDQVEGLIDLMGGGQATDDTLKEKVNELESTIKDNKEEKVFNDEFSNDVVPLFEKDNIEAKHQSAIRNLIHDLAFTQKYVNNDLSEIYSILKSKGKLDNYIKQEGKKSGEKSRSGTSTKSGGDDGDKDWKDMSDEEFDKKSDAAASKEPKFTIRHAGEDVRR